LKHDGKKIFHIKRVEEIFKNNEEIGRKRCKVLRRWKKI
jgi:hypothetical protein